MGKDRLLHCCTCDAYHRLSYFDKQPSYSMVGDVFEIIDQDDEKIFRDAHPGHCLETVHATGATYRPSGAAADPMQQVYFEVTNHTRRWWVRRYRNAITEPMHYEQFDGTIEEITPLIECQSAAIRKEMELHYDWAPARCLSDEKIDRLLVELRAIVSDCPASEFPIVEVSNFDDQVSYGNFGPSMREKLYTRCSSWMRSDELAALKRFVEAHSSGCDVMAVVLRSRFKLEPNAAAGAVNSFGSPLLEQSH